MFKNNQQTSTMTDSKLKQRTGGGLQRVWRSISGHFKNAGESEDDVDTIPELTEDEESVAFTEHSADLSEELNDDEIEQLEELRRNGVSSASNDSEGSDDGEYYTLPPSRENMMKDWLEWRKTINDMMSEVSAKYKDTYCFEPEREILTSPNSSKTPEFFNGPLSIHGQRVKDQYGCVPICEEDDIDSRIEKKVMEGNFYLFGIPRLSVRRCSASVIDSEAKFERSRRKTASVADTDVAGRARSKTFSEGSDLTNTEDLLDIDSRPFNGIAVARRNSLASSGLSSCTARTPRSMSMSSDGSMRRFSRLPSIEHMLIDLHFSAFDEKEETPKTLDKDIGDVFDPHTERRRLSNFTNCVLMPS